MEQSYFRLTYYMVYIQSVLELDKAIRQQLGAKLRKTIELQCRRRVALRVIYCRPRKLDSHYSSIMVYIVYTFIKK